MVQRKAPPVADDPDWFYPSIERFLETEEAASVGPRFEATRGALLALPKAKSEQGKRAIHAIARTEELLALLFETKVRLAKEGEVTRKARR